MKEKHNNFDLIRLAAALQVVVQHVATHFDSGATLHRFLRLLTLFPGVPVFFFISGFLISKSFESNPALRDFAWNRFLRIFPALVVCFVVSLASAWFSGYFGRVHVPVSTMALWVVSQLSFGEFYNPTFMRHYGIGVLNGSVWTISVELQFYLLVPVTYELLRIMKTSILRSNAALLCLVLVFVIVNQAYLHIEARSTRPLWYRLVGVSFLPWFYMFLIGILFQRNVVVLRRFFGGMMVPVLIGYCGIGFVVVPALGWGFGNSLNPLLFVALSVLTFSTAFSKPELSESLMHRNDISYGTYLYHMPVVNLLIAQGWAAGSDALVIVVAATVGLAYGSWRLVERPALSLKRHSLYQHYVTSLSL